jgi:serpin B
MDRRRFLALCTAPLVASVVDACSSDHPAASNTTPVKGTGSGTVVGGTATGSASRSDIARSTTSPEDALEASGALNAFGMDVYRKLAATQPAGNLVYSPTSIAVALAMTQAGAAGTTLAQMATALHIQNATTIHHAMNALLTQLARHSTGSVQLSIADALFAQQGTRFGQPFLDQLAAEYGAGVQLVDYRSNPDAARATINAWVADQTKGAIADLLAAGDVDNNSRLTLVDAIHLEARWLQVFDPSVTDPATFTPAGGAARQVPTMHLTATLPYATGDGWQSIDLAYESDDLSMVLFLPEDGHLARFEQEFLLGDSTSYFSPTRVALSLPKFSVTGSFQLADLLGSLGMVQAFTKDADFRAISPDEPLHISAVVHRADLTVGERGTVASAATAVVAAAGAAAPPSTPPIELAFDRPFVFAVRDRSTEAILFIGRVGDPGS